MSEIKYGITAKPNGTYTVAPTSGTTGWIVFNADCTVSHQQYAFSREVKGEALAPYIDALQAYLGTTAPAASYSLKEVINGGPALSFAAMTDAQLLDAVYARVPVHQTPAMRRYILREVRYQLKCDAPALSDTDLKGIVQDAWETANNAE